MLPVLPLLLAGGATAGRSRARPLAIIAGLICSFTVFTLAGVTILDALGLPQDFLHDVAIGLLLLLAATLIVPKVGELVERPFLALTRHRAGANANGFVLGASLGLVFVPCASLVLATVTTVAAAGEVSGRAVGLTLAYAAGAAIPMLLVAYGGQRLAGGITALRAHAVETRRAAGVLLAATALAFVFNFDTRLASAIPNYTDGLLSSIEHTGGADQRLLELRGAKTPPRSDNPVLAASTKKVYAPDFQGISDWINTPGGKPLSIDGLKGKVVLVDFWTYSCINCIRTFPHLEAWWKAYRPAGLVIVGIHTPEFAFERVPSNVRGAVGRFGIRYPVAIDNGYKTWNAWANQYWPAEYLVDRTGVVRDAKFGEGEYDKTEALIRELLGQRASARPTAVADLTPKEVLTPETYLGYARLDRFVGNVLHPNVYADYRFPPAPLGESELAYTGRWRVGDEHITAGSGAGLRLHVHAQHIYIVLSGRGRVDALLDGARLRTIHVSGLPRLYTVIDGQTTRDGVLELRFSLGLQAYSFTFG